MPGWPLGDCLTPILALHCPRSTIANALLTSRRALSRRLLKFSGGSGDDYATFSASVTSPSC